MMVNPYDGLPEAECLLKFIEERMKRKKGINMLFTGDVGSGKSFNGARLLELWYKRRFNEPFPTSNITNNIEESIVLAKSFKRLGEGMLCEELSVHSGRRDALTTDNKAYNKFLDIIRIKQIVLVGNAPHISFIDKHIIMASQVWIDCQGIDFKNKVGLTHPLWLQTSPHKNEPYKHKFLNKDGEPIDECFFRLPSPYILKDYDIMKLRANEQIFDEIVMKLRHNRVLKLKKMGQKILSPKEQQAYQFWIDGYKGKEAAVEMKLENVNTYHKYLRTAKNKLKTPPYSEYAKELAQNQKKTKSSQQNIPLKIKKPFDRLPPMLKI